MNDKRKFLIGCAIGGAAVVSGAAAVWGMLEVACKSPARRESRKISDTGGLYGHGLVQMSNGKIVSIVGPGWLKFKLPGTVRSKVACLSCAGQSHIMLDA